MSEIADLTYNVVAFTEIMQMIWKRLNDHGKNWRHVYKALLLLEYLIKTGSEKVNLNRTQIRVLRISSVFHFSVVQALLLLVIVLFTQRIDELNLFSLLHDN